MYKGIGIYCVMSVVNQQPAFEINAQIRVDPVKDKRLPYEDHLL